MAASETTYAEFQFVNDHALSSDFLDALQRETFDYFVYEANPLNGLIADKTQAGSPASIAARRSSCAKTKPLWLQSHIEIHDGLQIP